MAARKIHKTPAKADSPPLTMRVENGRLVCLTPYDQERIDTYRNREFVEVYVVAPMSKLRKRWEAIVGEAVKKCRTPWANQQVARESIKLALDHVRLVDVNGRIERHAESLDVMTDDEFELFYEMSMLVLLQITGVEPETLWHSSPFKMIEHEEIPMSAALPSAAEQVAASVSPQAEPATDVAPARLATGGREQRALMVDCARRFFQAATDPDVNASGRQETLKFAADAWKGKLPDDFVKACLDRCNDVVLGRMSVADAKRIIGALLP